MFLKGLNDMQQKLFLGVAQQLVEADGTISTRERDMINALSDEMGQRELVPAPDDEVLQAFFPDRGSRTAVMLELIGLAACDGVVAAEERIIRRLQRAFGIPDAEIKAYQAWVNRFLTIRAEAAQFFVGPVRARPAGKPGAKAKTKAKTPAKVKPAARSMAKVSGKAAVKGGKKAAPAPKAGSGKTTGARKPKARR